MKEIEMTEQELFQFLEEIPDSMIISVQIGESEYGRSKTEQSL